MNSSVLSTQIMCVHHLLKEANTEAEKQLPEIYHKIEKQPFVNTA